MIKHDNGSFIMFCVILIGYTFWGLVQPGFAEELPQKFPPLASHLKKPYTNDLSGLIERQVIRVLTTFNKTNFFLSNNRPYGFEYSLLKEYEKFLNKQISRQDLKISMEFIPVARDQLLPGLIDGLGDIAAAGLTITPERLEEVDFTDPYVENVDEVIVTHVNVSGLNTLEDLSGRIAFIRKSSSYYESLLSLNKELYNKKKKLPVYVLGADESLETEDILEIVNSGAWNMTVADSTIAEIWAGVFDNLHIHSHLKVRTGAQIAWMVRKNNPELKKSLNKFIKTHRQGTLLGNIYFNRYFKKNQWIHNPLDERDLKKRRKYIELFKKYASKYGFDWMLILAMAYQESKLDQNKKDSRGAIGVMQIQPKTASDKNINIKNVHLVENNIHAGVKYLAFLRDHYFNDEHLQEQDRIRLTLAAYNAGPGNIQKARKLAEKMELDPSRWFGNVEIAALKHISQVPMHYVSNINKYYLLYKFYEEREEIRSATKKKVIEGD